jgi:hypothetical protein
MSNLIKPTEVAKLHEMSIMVPSIVIAKEFDPEADSYGDVRIRWDPTKPEQVRRAREAFQKAISKGFRAIVLDRKDNQIGSYLTTFDPKAERIAFIPAIQGGMGPRLDALLDKTRAASNQDGKVGEWAWHVHHAVLYEKLTEPMKNRIDYVKASKTDDPTLRLKLMRVVKDQSAMTKIVKGLEADQKSYDNALDRAKDEYRKGGKDDPKYLQVADEATAAYDDLIEAETSLLKLHRQECEPDCPWNGVDIFKNQVPSV